MLSLRKSVFAPITFALFFLSLLFISPQVARADGIVISSGYVNIGGTPFSRNEFRGIDFNFASENVTVRGGRSDDIRQGISSPCIGALCSPGTMVSPNSNSILTGVGTAMISGVTTNAWYFGNDSTLNFSGLSIAIPDTNAPTLTLATPFTMTGNLIIHSLDIDSHPVIFSTTISGEGIAFLTLQYSTRAPFGTGYVLASVRYEFNAVPEPTTLLLLGTGLAGLAARHRRRRHQASAD